MRHQYPYTEHELLEFHDAWEWDLRDFIYQFLWACRAIQWGIAKFRDAQVSVQAGL